MDASAPHFAGRAKKGRKSPENARQISATSYEWMVAAICLLVETVCQERCTRWRIPEHPPRRPSRWTS